MKVPTASRPPFLATAIVAVAFAVLSSCADPITPSGLRALEGELPSGLVPAVAERLEIERASVRATPASPDSWLALGMTYEANQLANLARESYTELLRLDPGSARGWFRLGTLQLAASELEEAEASFLRASEAAPDYGPARWRLGMIRLELGDVSGATEAFAAARERAPEDPGGWLGEARIQLQSGAPRAAIPWLERALELRPGDPYARQLLGQAWLRAGDEARGLGYLEGLGAAPPRLSDPWTDEVRALSVPTAQSRLLEAHELYARGDPQGAILLLEALEVEGTEELMVLSWLGVCYATVGRLDDAHAALERVLEREPERRDALLSLARVQAISGDHELAVATLERTLALHPSFAPALEQRGDLALEMEQPGAAIAAYERALAHDQRATGIRGKLGRAQLALRRYEDAALTFQQLIAEQATPNAWLSLAQAELGRGAWPAAEAALEQAKSSGAAPADLRRIERTLARKRAAAARDGD